MELTVDPGVGITERGLRDGVPFVTYVVFATGEQWTVVGTCSCCGLCEVGSVNPFLRWQGEPDTPNACVDVRHPDRLDVPVTPAFFAPAPWACSLRLG